MNHVLDSNVLYWYSEGGEEYDVVQEVVVEYPIRTTSSANGSPSTNSGAGSDTVSEEEYDDNCDDCEEREECKECEEDCD
jgi:hypothetical protein